MDDKLIFWNRIFQTSKLRKRLYDHPSVKKSQVLHRLWHRCTNQALTLSFLGFEELEDPPERSIGWLDGTWRIAGSIGYSMTNCLIIQNSWTLLEVAMSPSDFFRCFQETLVTSSASTMHPRLTAPGFWGSSKSSWKTVGQCGNPNTRLGY